jgi:hypothetical protein
MCSRYVDGCGTDLVADGSARPAIAQLLDDAAEMQRKRLLRPFRKRPSLAQSNLVLTIHSLSERAQIKVCLLLSDRWKDGE